MIFPVFSLFIGEIRIRDAFAGDYVHHHPLFPVSRMEVLSPITPYSAGFRRREERRYSLPSPSPTFLRRVSRLVSGGKILLPGSEARRASETGLKRAGDAVRRSVQTQGATLLGPIGGQVGEAGRPESA